MSNPHAKNGILRRGLDRAGIVVSVMCAVHCVATIVIVTGLGIGGHFLLAEEIHHFALIVAIVIAAGAIGWGMRLHHRREPFLIAIVGLAFMAGALAVEHGVQEAILTIIGVAIVSVGHILNLRAARQ